MCKIFAKVVIIAELWLIFHRLLGKFMKKLPIELGRAMLASTHPGVGAGPTIAWKR